MNGTSLGACVLVRSWQPCSWLVPASVVNPAGNLVTIATTDVALAPDAAATGDERRIGVALRQIRLTRIPGGN